MAHLTQASSRKGPTWGNLGSAQPRSPLAQKGRWLSWLSLSRPGALYSRAGPGLGSCWGPLRTHHPCPAAPEGEALGVPVVGQERSSGGGQEEAKGPFEAGSSICPHRRRPPLSAQRGGGAGEPSGQFPHLLPGKERRNPWRPGAQRGLAAAEGPGKLSRAYLSRGGWAAPTRRRRRRSGTSPAWRACSWATPPGWCWAAAAPASPRGNGRPATGAAPTCPGERGKRGGCSGARGGPSALRPPPPSLPPSARGFPRQVAASGWSAARGTARRAQPASSTDGRAEAIPSGGPGGGMKAERPGGAAAFPGTPRRWRRIPWARRSTFPRDRLNCRPGPRSPGRDPRPAGQ